MMLKIIEFQIDIILVVVYVAALSLACFAFFKF